MLNILHKCPRGRAEAFLELEGTKMGARRLKLKINEDKMLRLGLFSTVRSFSFLLTIRGHDLGDTRRPLKLIRPCPLPPRMEDGSETACSSLQKTRFTSLSLTSQPLRLLTGRHSTS